MENWNRRAKILWKVQSISPHPFSTIDVILKNDSKIRKKGGP
jgi:hypothetical protein